MAIEINMSGELEGKIREAIEAAGGVLGFDEFMEMALYDEEWGYYCGDREVTGRGGDFYTSVSVGPLFGAVLASSFVGTWEAMGRPRVFDLVEQGAHDGQLAQDVMAALVERSRACFEAVRYGVVEPLARRRERQMTQLASWGDKVQWWESVEALPERAGVFFCNELLDAFPFKWVRFEAGAWWELGVGLEENGFLGWRRREIEAGSELSAEIGRWGLAFAEGYTTEVNLRMVGWVASVAKALKAGELLVIDYGFREEEYLSNNRVDGTLRCYSTHRAGDDPLASVGGQDITAHVNFTLLERAALAAGLGEMGLTDQHDFVVNAGRELLRAREGVADAAFAKQFQTLMHPGMMGRVFKVARFRVERAD
ncbi:MAG: SAM-dependent methyltransferase [Verrucomicrobiota bacterium]